MANPLDDHSPTPNGVFGNDSNRPPHGMHQQILFNQASVLAGSAVAETQDHQQALTTLDARAAAVFRGLP